MVFKVIIFRLNTLPSEVSIDNNGLLTVKKEIKAGTYGFIVRVETKPR